MRTPWSSVFVCLLLGSCSFVADSAEPTAPSTTDVYGNTEPRPTDLRSIDFEALDQGQTVEVDWVHPCSFAGVFRSRDERYLIDRTLAVATGGSGFVQSDFADDLDVYIYNEGSVDGPNYAILNVTMKRVDDDTIEMRNGADGVLIANFVRDSTDPAGWGYCG